MKKSLKIFILLIFIIGLLKPNVNAVFVASDCPYKLNLETISVQHHVLAIDKEGYLWAWGDNYYGQIGDGTNNDSNVPIQVKQNTKFLKISAGQYHSLAIDESGNLWAWGKNSQGALGDGTTNNSSVPIQIKSGTKFKDISAGWYYSLAIDESGNLWAWGYNAFGQLGNGTKTDSVIPIQIKSGTKFTKVSAERYQSFAIDETGNLWAWGDNDVGQLGNGTTIDSAIPIKIKSGTKFKDVEPGNLHTIAIDASGNLWTWGKNTEKQLGNGTTTNSSTPVQIKSGTKFKDITCGANLSLAIDEDGNLWGTGWDSTTNTPTQILEGIKFKEVSSGQYDRFAIDEDGNLWVWGTNSDGQFGNGTTTGSSVPVQITKATSTITLDTSEGPIDVEYVKGEDITLPQNITKPGYTFAGWYDNENLEGESITSVTKDEAEGTKYYARWEQNKDTITLDTSEGPIDVEYVEGEDITLPQNITKPGYTFVGWYDNENLEGESITNVTKGEAEGTKYYAKWEQNKDTITLDTSEGAIDVEYVEGEDITLPQNITKPGYTFAGWYDNENLEGESITNVTKDSAENTKYYAKWEKEDNGKQDNTIEEDRPSTILPNTGEDTFIKTIIFALIIFSVYYAIRIRRYKGL